MVTIKLVTHLSVVGDRDLRRVQHSTMWLPDPIIRITSAGAQLRSATSLLRTFTTRQAFITNSTYSLWITLVYNLCCYYNCNVHICMKYIFVGLRWQTTCWVYYRRRLPFMYEYIKWILRLNLLRSFYNISIITNTSLSYCLISLSRI